MPVSASAAVSANQPMKPTVFSPPASVTSVANHTSTFQAALLPMMSFHCDDPGEHHQRDDDQRHHRRIDEVAAEDPQGAAPGSPAPPMISSLRDTRPILPSSSAAHAGTSVPDLISGG